LTLSSAALAISALPGKLLAQHVGVEVFSNGNLGAYSQGLLTLEAFQRLVGSEFRVFFEDGSITPLTLLSVTDRNQTAEAILPAATAPQQKAARAYSEFQRAPVAGLTTSAFDLRFSVNGAPLAQQSYTLDHASLGRFAAFLVPGLSTAGGNTCTGSFNYLAGSPAAPGPIKLPRYVPEMSFPVGSSGSQSATGTSVPQEIAAPSATLHGRSAPID